MLVALLVCLFSLASTDWATIVKPIAKQVPRLEILARGGRNTGKCSGVVINLKLGYVLTAAHCLDYDRPAITVNGRNGKIIESNPLLDLALVQFMPKDEIEVKLAKQTPPIGSEIAIAGYSFGSAEITVQFGRISQPLNPETKTIWIDGRIVPGQSGGLVLNKKGELVGMTQAIYYNGASDMGAAIPVEKIADFLQPYLPVQVVK
jgi:S1-C subfamily serine protease